MRARWKIEDLARGQWQLVVTELPPALSSAKVLEEIEELTNPKGQDRQEGAHAGADQLKASVLAVLDAVRDRVSKDAPVRLVFEPKEPHGRSSGADHHAAGAHQPGDQRPVNLTMVGLDGRPVQKSLRQMLAEWMAFRQATVRGVRSIGWTRCWTASTCSRPAAGAAEHRRVIRIIRAPTSPSRR